MVRKSDAEKAEIRRQVEARRRPDKDRTTHQAKRGAGQVSKDPSKTPPTAAELDASLLEMHEGNDRVCAILGGTLVDFELRDWIIRSLPSRKHVSQLLDDPGAPLGSFSARITVAKALGLISENMAAELDHIRRIRNAFAHSLRPLTFDHDDVATHCRKLPDRDTLAADQIEIERRELSENRMRFESACFHASTQLLFKGREITKETIEILSRSLQDISRRIPENFAIMQKDWQNLLKG